MPAERFHSGWNLAEQEPTEEPACHATWPRAAESLKMLMSQWADEDDSQCLEEVDWDLVTPEREDDFWNSDAAPAMLATVRSILRDDGPREPEDYYATIEDHQYRKVVFWLRKVICDDPIHLEQQPE